MDTNCLCCADEMASDQLICWDCYKLTNRATPGTYPHLEGTSTIDGVSSVVITSADVDRWSDLRDARS